MLGRQKSDGWLRDANIDTGGGRESGKMYHEMVYYNRMHVKTRPKTKLVPIFIVKDCILAQTVRLCKSALRKRFIHEEYSVLMRVVSCLIKCEVKWSIRSSNLGVSSSSSTILAYRISPQAAKNDINCSAFTLKKNVMKYQSSILTIQPLRIYKIVKMTVL